MREKTALMHSLGKPLLTVALITLLIVPSATILVSAEPTEQELIVYGPKVDELLIKIYFAPDPQAMALRAGEIDIVDWPLPAAWVEEFKKIPEEIVLAPYVELGMYQIDINNQRWPTNITEFRRAIAHLVDKERIVTEIVKGYGVVLHSPVPPMLEEFISPYITIYEYNPAKAAEILDALGFEDIDGDGFREGPAGEKFALDFYIRVDDPRRKEAGLLLTEELEKVGIRVNAFVVERGVAFTKVMKEYDFHLYTGGWSLGRDPDYLYDLYHSDLYVAPEPWSINYVGFVNEEYDKWSYILKYNVTTREEAIEAAWRCTEILSEQVPIIPLWATVGVKAYRAEWTGIVNMPGYGVNVGWTFLNASRIDMPYGGTIRYGFKSDIESLNPLTAAWYWDWEVLRRVYDSLIVAHPYDLAIDLPWVAESWEIGTWEEGVKITFRLRDDVYWHDGVQLTSEDVKFTILAGQIPECWWRTAVDRVEKVETPDPLTVVVYYNVTSYWALRWVGEIPLLPKHIWEQIPREEWPTVQPQELPHPTVPGLTMLVGSGPFVFRERVIGEYVRLTRFEEYFARVETLFAEKITALEAELEELKAEPTLEGVETLLAKVDAVGEEVATLYEYRPTVEVAGLLRDIEGIRGAIAEVRAGILGEELEALAAELEGLRVDLTALQESFEEFSVEVEEAIESLEASLAGVTTLAQGLGAVATILAIVGIAIGVRAYKRES